jgi:hypothetical protein
MGIFGLNTHRSLKWLLIHFTFLLIRVVISKKNILLLLILMKYSKSLKIVKNRISITRIDIIADPELLETDEALGIVRE